MPDLEHIRAKLQAEQERLAALVERTGKHLYRRDEPFSPDFAEQAVEVENHQVVEQLDEDGKRHLQSIRRALARIDDGSYGVCTDCGVQINEQRLEAVPDTPHCVDCAGQKG